MQADWSAKPNVCSIRTAPVIRIFLVGEQELFLAGLRSLIQHEPGLTVIGQATTWTNSMRVEDEQPDIISVDPVFGNQHHLDSLPDLIQAAPKARVLIVTELADIQLHVHAIRLGAMGVIRKTESGENFLKAIRKIHSGELWVNRSLTAAFVHQMTQKVVDPEQDRIASLTRKELDVITLLSQGLRNKEIAERLFVADCTIRHHFTSIFDKLGLTDRLELLIYAYQHGLAKAPVPPRRNDRGESTEGKTRQLVRNVTLARSA